MDDFDRASRRARRCARGMLAAGLPPSIAGDAMLVQAVAVWAAQTDRLDDAADFLRAWVAFRDFQNGH